MLIIPSSSRISRMPKGHHHKYTCTARHHLTPSECDCGCPEKYWTLKIECKTRRDIWLADEFGHLVKKDFGVLEVRLLPGRYKYRLGLSGIDQTIVLNSDVYIPIGV
jgi:hypothetical protein